jgi:hypothetical protein
MPAGGLPAMERPADPCSLVLQDSPVFAEKDDDNYHRVKCDK